MSDQDKTAAPSGQAGIGDSTPPRPADASAAQEPTIVAIGASAGGLDALKRFFAAMPPHPRIAFVVIVHLAPRHESLLAELLKGSTGMQVAQAREGDKVEARHVYVIPPNRYLRIEQGRLHLESTVERPTIPLPIDYFMRSLAANHQGCVAGIVLTGADHDGTLGLKELKAAGGFTMAQEPATAQHPSMPQSAMAAEPDRVLPIEQMPRALVDFVDRIETALTQQPAAADPESTEPLKEVLDVVRARTGHDFRGYRPAMLLRRFRRRQALKQLPGAQAYLQMLRHEAEEAASLAGEFLIGITEFFREPAAWQFLEDHVVPKLVEKKAGDGPIRVWSAGCASGEEAYSIAMLLMQALEPEDVAGRANIFGTDIDLRSLKTARAGRYPGNIQVTVPQERLNRYFKKLDHGYEVRKDLREAVLFAPQNLLSDPPFSKLDLIICRNLLIYLQPSLQQKIIELFHFALNPGGYLFLGKSESLGGQAAQFEPVSKEWRIYRTVGMRTRLPKDLPSMAYDKPALGANADSREQGAFDPASIMHRLLLDGHAPAAVLVSRDYQAVYFQGRTEQYLETPSGEPSWDLPSMAREGLRIKLRAALHRAVSEEQPVSIDATVKRGSGLAEVRISVEPVRDLRSSGMLLVTFQDRPGEAPDDSATKVRVLDEASAFRQLETELANTRRELQNAVESLETANEELRVGNEEAMSTNEELQSSNEELQTSKEELQSLNEELATVNTQLEAKVEELQVANDDLNNLLSSTDIPTLFLDGSFRIKRFTSSAKLLYKLIDSDVNRQLSDIVSNMSDDSLLTDAQRVFDSLVPNAKEVHTASGETFLRRILPYRTEQDHIEGVVVTFTDITELRRAAEQLRRVATAVRDSNDAIIVYGLDGRICDWNKGASRIYGYGEDEALGMDIGSLVPPELRAPEAAMLERARTETVATYDSRRLSRDQGLIDVSITLSTLRDDQGRPWRLLSTERDITERKRMERVLRESEARFRGLADAIPALVWMDDARQQPQYVNRGFREFTGQPGEALEREGWMGLIHPDDLERYRAAYDDAFRRRAPFDEDLRLRRADGKYRWMRSSGVPRFQEDGTFAGSIGLIRDIHQRKLAEQKLAQADRRKSEFLAMLAHELRNPLAPIRTTAEVLRRVGDADPKVAWATGIIERQTQQLTGLVDELLDVARISSGKIALHLEPVELATAISRACETAHPLVESRNHDLSVDTPADPLYVEGDLLRLGQIFSNLINNAAKFTPEGGSIDVRLERRDKEALVSVRDNGAGIASDMLPQVFDLFSQADTSLDRSQGGLGLGLTLVRDLVKMHGGQVEARSAGLGQGSEFVVRLPLINAPARVKSGRDAPRAGNASLRILVADDNVDAAESLSMLLQMVGHEVRTANDGPQALKMVGDFSPDVILLDIGLPSMDGYEVARRLRARDEGKSVVLVAATGYGQPQDFEQSKAAGFDHHLVKPIDAAALLSLIETEKARGR